MNGKTLTLAALAATLMLGTSATASLAREGQREGHMGRGGPERMFVTMLQELDTNTDGKISKEEAAAGRDKMFSTVDADSNGALTPGEMRKHRETMMEARKAERAKNAPEAGTGPQEGAGAQAGMEPGPGPEAGADDEDRPGKRHHHAARGEDGPGRHGKGHWGGRDEAREGDRDGRPGPRGGMGMMRMADTDENGQISKEEAVAMGDRIFERMDKDKDGSITAVDFPKRGAWLR